MYDKRDAYCIRIVEPDRFVATTDGSGFVLHQPGDYVLVITSPTAMPQDTNGTNLFPSSADQVTARVSGT